MAKRRMALASRIAVSVSLVLLLAVTACFSPLEAHAARLDRVPGTFDGADSSGLVSLRVASDGSNMELGVAKKGVVKKAAKAEARSIVVKARATKGSKLKKLKKLYAYIAAPKKVYMGDEYKDFGGLLDYENYSAFFTAAYGTENAGYYPISHPKNMKKFYCKYAVDALVTGRATCHHFAALFAVAAKQVVGKKGVVRIATDNEKVSGARYVHSWVEVQLGKKNYIYDPMFGNQVACSIVMERGSTRKLSYGEFCGEKGTNRSSSTRTCTVK